jgi:hypothetical protein
MKDNRVTVEGRHECNCEESCVVTKFQRTYQLPRNVDPRSVEASMGADRVLQLSGRQSHQHNALVDPAERQIVVDTQGFTEHASTAKCSPSKPGLHIAKRDPRTGRVFVVRDDYVDNSASNNDSLVQATDDVTIEVEEYE